MRWKIFSDSTELAVECLHTAGAIGVSVETVAAEHCLDAACSALDRSEAVALAVVRVPTLEEIVELAHASRYGRRLVVLAILAREREAEFVAPAAAELGLVVVRDVGALAATLALCDAGAEQPWAASTRGLPAKDRVRLDPSLSENSRNGGHLRQGTDGGIAWSAQHDGESRSLGRVSDVGEAIDALRRVDRSSVRVLSSVDGIEAQSVMDVIFGPRRALSDPASKRALAPYGIPMPVEELCTSPSRTAAEATRIGYPVRIALASPDLRVWDHPELCIDMVDNAARARDAFHQLITLAQAKLSDVRGVERRLLGVVVSATGEATASLSVHARPLPHGRVAMEIAFADPHGQAAGDAILAVLPTPAEALGRTIARLRGSALLLPESPALRKANLESISDVLLRLAAFVEDHRGEVEWVKLKPLALLPDGTAEVREACVQVSDAFERMSASSDAALG